MNEWMNELMNEVYFLLSNATFMNEKNIGYLIVSRKALSISICIKYPPSLELCFCSGVSQYPKSDLLYAFVKQFLNLLFSYKSTR